VGRVSLRRQAGDKEVPEVSGYPDYPRGATALVALIRRRPEFRGVRVRVLGGGLSVSAPVSVPVEVLPAERREMEACVQVENLERLTGSFLS
jgi:hypothetical protein